MTTNPKLEVMPLTTELDRASFGGKAAGLARAIKLGFRVPAGFAISVAATQQAPERGEELAAILQAAMTELRPPFAVRSSGLDEDSADASRAGQYRTFLSVKEEGLTSAVLECCLPIIK